MLVLGTLGARERRRVRGRHGHSVEQGQPEPVPTARATLVQPQPFATREQAEAWLAELRKDHDRAQEELAAACRTLNRAVHAHRVALADPYAPELTPDKALVARIGFGAGEDVADGEFDSAWELQGTTKRRPRRSMETPDERFAAILGGREQALAGEELVLRARADLEAGRNREAALQARVALEALLAELPAEGPLARARGELEADRALVGECANEALRGDLSQQLTAALEEMVSRMEALLRRHRLSG